jgi:hypothetical protein
MRLLGRRGWALPSGLPLRLLRLLLLLLLRPRRLWSLGSPLLPILWLWPLLPKLMYFAILRWPWSQLAGRVLRQHPWPGLLTFLGLWAFCSNRKLKLL